VNGFVSDAIAQELPYLRAEAEARMTSRVTIHRQSGRTQQNETTGRETPVWDVIATDVPFRSSGSAAAGGSAGVTVGGVTYEQATAVGHLPAGTDLSDDDLLEVAAGEWVGQVWRVVKAVALDQRTARRFPLAEEQRPEEWG
jgi:hypothetical protein